MLIILVKFPKLLFLLTNHCDLPIKWYAPVSLYTEVSSGYPRSCSSHYYRPISLAWISKADHVVVAARPQTERGDQGMSCGSPTTSSASRDSDCCSMKRKQPRFINAAQCVVRDAKPWGTKQLQILHAVFSYTIVTTIYLHYELSISRLRTLYAVLLCQSNQFLYN